MRYKKGDCKACGKQYYLVSKGFCAFCYERQRKKTPLPRPTKPIPKESKKRKKERPIYIKLAKQHKLDNPYCQAKLEGCTLLTTETHHMQGRGIHYLDTSKFLAVCKNCHDQITEHSAEAIKLRLSYSRL